MKDWPKDQNETASFTDLTEPLREVVSQAYVLKRKNEEKDLNYDGYNVGQDTLVCSHDPVTALTATQLKYDNDEQGRDAMKIILGIAVQLGIEQGKRLAFRDMKSNFDMIRMAKESLDVVLNHRS